ncbi:helix-turn-helix domain-containing protein [Achromobacter sp. NPDC058515]|uniref:helix-turn-helix domain-containing protein n=1 Tax=Achromobacter sp. NPDC058515 TaxID=3346533 RepID=UPI003661F294
MTQDFASAVSDTSAGAAASVGSALRALRQSKGWSLDEVSSRIKFSTKQIEALEDERWADLPTGVSLRGLVRNYARLLGADSQSIVDSLDPKARVTGPVKLSPGALHSAHSIPQSSADDERSSSTSWGWLIAIVLVLAAGVAYAFWQGWLPQQWLPSDWLPKPTK